MKRIVLLLLLAAGTSCTGTKSLERIAVEVISSEFIYESASFPSCHASTLVETGDGLLAAWFGGSYESHPDVSVYCSSYDGSTWSAPIRVADGTAPQHHLHLRPPPDQTRQHKDKRIIGSAPSFHFFSKYRLRYKK